MATNKPIRYTPNNAERCRALADTLLEALDHNGGRLPNARELRHAIFADWKHSGRVITPSEACRLGGDFSYDDERNPTGWLAWRRSRAPKTAALLEQTDPAVPMWYEAGIVSDDFGEERYDV